MPQTDIVAGDQSAGSGFPAWVADLLKIDELPSNGDALDIGG